MNSKKLHIVTFILLVLGGVNWGLIGLFDWGIGNILPSGIAQLVYVLIGAAAVYELVSHKKTCSVCDTKGAVPSSSPNSGGA